MQRQRLLIPLRLGLEIDTGQQTVQINGIRNIPCLFDVAKPLILNQIP